MTAHPLDNPVWSSLAGPHARFVQRRGNVLRYPADVSPFIGLPDEPGAADWADLARWPARARWWRWPACGCRRPPTGP